MRKIMRLLALVCLFFCLHPVRFSHADIPLSVSIKPQYGRLLATGITGNSAVSANALITLTRDRYILFIVSSVNQEISLTYDGIEFARFETTDKSMTIDLRASGLNLLQGKVVGVFHQGVAPASGSIRATAL